MDSESDACLREREEPGLMSMLVVMNLGATIRRIQRTFKSSHVVRMEKQVLFGHFLKRLI